MANVRTDYLKWTHPGGEDEQGRTPLLMTTHGKHCTTSTIQRNVPALTRPYHYTGKCPIGLDIEECEATTYNTASKCSGSVGPHAPRRGYVTEALNAGHLRPRSATQVDMSIEVLDLHYDHATKSEKMERREGYLVDI